MKFYAETICRTLENGVRIFMLPQPGSAVLVQCVIQTGSIHEGLHLGCGLSHFLEHMMFQGCRNYPGTAASDAIDAIGGNINAYTSFDHTCYYTETAGHHLAKAIDVIGSMIRYPEFPEARFRSERDVILRERELGQDNPNQRLFEHFNSLLYQQHPVRVPVIGLRPMIASVTREMMCQYYEKRYTPGRTFWVVTGDFDPENAVDLIRGYMDDWQISSLAGDVLPAEPPVICPRRSSFEFSDPVARLAVGFQLPAITSPEIPALDIASGILGLGDGSRLTRILKMEKELALSLRCSCISTAGRGLCGIFASAVPSKLSRLENALLKELDLIRKNGFSAAEIRREKTQQTADALRNQRSLREISANIVNGVVAANAPDLTDRYMDKLNALSVDEINHTVRHYFNADTFAVVRQEVPRPASKRSVPKKQTELQPTATELSNGTRCVSITDRRLPLVEMSLLLPGGTIFEPEKYAGISSILADTLYAGAGKYSEKALFETFDACGAEININAGLNSFILEMSVPRKSLKRALNVLSVMLAEPRFETAVFERERFNRLELLNSRRQDPRARAAAECSRLLYGSHPYSWGTPGKESVLANLTPADTAAFYRGLWNRKQVIIGFGGDCTPEEAQKWAEEFDRSIPFDAPPMLLPDVPVFPDHPEQLSIALPREQTAIMLAFPAPKLDGALLHDCEILQHAENGLSSRLFKMVREDNALAYTTGMQLSGGFHPGQFRFFAVTSAESADKAAALLRSEAERLASAGLDAAEFESAREGAAFAVTRAAESVAAALSSTVLEMHYRRPPEELLRHGELLRERTLAAVNALLKESFSTASTVEVRAGKIR